MDHETMDFDVVIVGGGPSGLAAGIHLKQLSQQHHHDLRVCILEKGAQIGAHIMAGAVLEPDSLKTLLPDHWQDAPLDTPVTEDRFYFMLKEHALRLPTPKFMHNQGNYIISLGDLCQFLATQAEQLGCEIYPGFAAANLLFDEDGAVKGVETGAVGIDKQGNTSDRYQPGMHLLAKQTLFAEGCRGELSQRLMAHFNLSEHAQPQTYAIGFKEIWEIPAKQHRQGEVIHTLGWPLDHGTYGGSFMYHFSNNRVSLGFAIGLDYKNPWLNPFAEFQRFKTHPMIRQTLAGGERIAYGARAINEGGWQALPKLTFPGGCLLGDAAGFLNVPKIKGIHTAIQSGMIAAKTTFDWLQKAPSTANSRENTSYTDEINRSSIRHELFTVRNIRPGFRYGLLPGLTIAAFETYISRGHLPWTLKHHPDYSTLMPADKAKKINYPKPDGVLTFDRLSSVYLTNTFHEENQPSHLKLKDPSLAISVNYQQYASPETRYCPAAVYEIVDVNQQPTLQINAQNCIHCKTCDIKDPRQNIVWTAPEGGGGPNYHGM